MSPDYNYLRELEPNVVEEASFNDMFLAALAVFKRSVPEWTENVNDPVYIMIRQAVMRDFQNIQRTNAQQRRNLLPFATGNTLAAFGMFKGLVQGERESDREFQDRISETPTGAPYPVGTEDAVRYFAKQAKTESIIDISTSVRANRQDIDVYILSNETPSGSDLKGTASDELIGIVDTYINASHRIPAGYTYYADTATITAYTVTGAIFYNEDTHDPQPLIAAAQQRVVDYANANYRFNKSITVEGIGAALQGTHESGVIRNTLTAPSTSLDASDDTVYLGPELPEEVTITATAV